MPEAKPNNRTLDRFASYPAYKEPGAEWLGEIPAHWEVQRLKRFWARADYGVSESLAGNGEIKVLTMGHIQEGEILLPEDGSLNEVPDVLLLEANDLLFNRTNSRDLVGKVGLFRGSKEDRVSFASYLVRLRARPNVSPEYLNYLLNSEGLVTLARSLALLSVNQANLNPTRYGEIFVPRPPVEEQQSIASFLDSETARIDALVAKKERLVELLQEKRTALITRAVTKGLDPNVPMKDSGAEWLGEIPAHWTAKHLRWAIMFQRGHDLPTDEREDGQVPVVSSSGISSMHSRAVAKAPGIVTGRYGTIGHFHLITVDYWPLNTTLYSIDLRRNEPRFLRYMLTHLSPLFLLNAVKSAVPGVDRNDIHPARTGVPPIHEQREIADFLDAKNAEIDRLAAKVRDAIDHVKELRTALISAAVTGKIDVRSEAHELPEDR